MQNGKNLDTRLLVSETTLINEEWKVVENFPFYRISNYGRLINKYNRVLKPRLQNSGYYFYSLYDGRGRDFQTQITVHKLVMMTFVGLKIGYDINHIDGNKLNNHLNNLEYITHSDNAKHAYNIGINKGRKGFKHPRPFKSSMYLKVKNYID
nr:MAG TPA: homing endonuclease [Caudoviricetes sp.]